MIVAIHGLLETNLNICIAYQLFRNEIPWQEYEYKIIHVLLDFRVRETNGMYDFIHSLDEGGIIYLYQLKMSRNTFPI